MTTTTIKISTQTKKKLNQFREYKNETYDEIVNKIAGIARDVEDSPELSQETLRRVEAARKRIANGEYYTEEELREKLGL